MGCYVAIPLNRVFKNGTCYAAIGRDGQKAEHHRWEVGIMPGVMADLSGTMVKR